MVSVIVIIYLICLMIILLFVAGAAKLNDQADRLSEEYVAAVHHHIRNAA
jgi:hypothetical protein